MNANLTNALKALLRIRKAYTIMSNIYQIEQDYASKLAAQDGSTRISASSRRRSFDFSLAAGVDDFSSLSDNPVDHFIHVGLCFSYGMLQWALSIVPAPFDKALAFMSFKGDRTVGHSLMWEATKYPEDIHGALSSFTTLIIYNGLSSRCDIRPADAVPYDRVTALLQNLRRLYPDSHKWDVQQAMMLASHERKLEEAIQVLQPGVEDKQAPKFITALCVFEQGCKYLFAHNYDACAKSFTELPKYTDWSVALFHYIVGISYVDAHRKALRNGGDPEQTKRYAALANKSLSLVMGECGKRKVLGRPVPIEVYVKNNMNRYLAKQAAQKCTLVEAIDVSPAEELIWLHGAHDSMPEAQLQVSLEELESYKTANDEEAARTALLKAACLRSLGQISSAREEIEQHVLIHTSTARNWGRHASNWVLPAADYEVAVCLWHEAGPDKQDQAKLRACAEHLKAASKASGHDLQTFQGIKISTGIGTLKKLGIEV
ncbi:hypothetical protein AMS68_004634 [Peltaster fructicola]|uniref:Inclusion body clearance protein IML2 n=1 Tax=Peltaster fructicola TaxID=286661 RepID=A0A6H0XWH6_9PEZI|nr:hypothetical protein AMS68_004634 [Peltaster fructicola]